MIAAPEVGFLFLSIVPYNCIALCLAMLQDHLGRAEGYGIVHADEQYIVPTDGKPVRGLIQVGGLGAQPAT